MGRGNPPLIFSPNAFLHFHKGHTGTLWHASKCISAYCVHWIVAQF